MDVRFFDVPFVGFGRENLSLGLFSDLHLEVGGCNAAQREGIESALKKNCRLSFNGDSMDYIYPKDPRYTGSRDKKGAVTAKLNMDVEYLYEFFREYVDHIDVISAGNHEKTVAKHYNYDVLRGVLQLLSRDRSKRLPPIFQGAYKGYQIYNLRSSNCVERSFKVFRHHLRGGSAPVSKGMIDIARLSDGVDDADLLWGGHKHTAISDSGRMRKRVTSSGVLRHRIVKAVITPGYGGKAEDTSKEIDILGDDDGWEDSHYTETPTGWGYVRVIPRHSDHKYLITQRLELIDG